MSRPVETPLDGASAQPMPDLTSTAGQPAQAEDAARSMLMLDVGSCTTRACLVDLVDGRFRLLAQAEVATELPSGHAITEPVREAIRKIEEIAQRDLMRKGVPITPETEDATGADLVLAAASAAPPLDCVLIGLTRDLSIESARRACSGSHALVRQTIILGRRAQNWDNRAISLLRETPPDVLIMVGGVDTSPTQSLEDAAQVLAVIYQDVAEEKRPVVVFAGNQEARRPITRHIGETFDVRFVDNVRPNLHTETLSELQRELEELYAVEKLAALPGYHMLSQWCSAPIATTTEALSTTWRFMAERNHLAKGVLGLDLGGSTTYVGAAHGGGYQWTTAAAIGTSIGIEGLIDASGLRDIARWLPQPLEPEVLTERLENMRLRPLGIPTTREDLDVTLALVRQALLLTIRRMRRQHWHQVDKQSAGETTPSFDVIAVRGGTLSSMHDDALLGLTLLDAIQPTGLAHLVIDWASIWPQLGMLAQIAPLAALQVLSTDSLRHLGTVIAPIGEASDGERALQITFAPRDGESREISVPAGTIRCLPLASDQEAEVSVRPSRAFDIGLGNKGQGGKAKVQGGSLGIVIDTRGRPLSLPEDSERRQARMQEWLGLMKNGTNA